MSPALAQSGPTDGDGGTPAHRVFLPNVSSASHEPVSPDHRSTRIFSDGRSVQAPTQEAISPTSSAYCDVETDYPHKSTHVPGTINVVGRTRCNVSMNVIGVRTVLEKGNLCIGLFCLWYTRVGTWGENQQNYRTQVQANSAASCVSGVYRGYSEHWGAFPSGHSFFSNSWSAAVSINCS